MSNPINYVAKIKTNWYYFENRINKFNTANMKKLPSITQKIILRYKNRILILKHKNKIYDFPGGRIEWREDLSSSLNRELKEELNFCLKEHPRLFHVWNYISESKNRHSVMIYYIYDLDKNYKFIPEPDIEILWLNKKDMKLAVRDGDFVERMFNWKNPRTSRSIFYAK